MNKEQIAKTAHEVNRAYCLSIGDNSQPSWDEAPGWQKDSALRGVDFHLEKDRKPSESHESWLRQKEEDGWTYGPEKDPEAKEHPCMVSFEQLPHESWSNPQNRHRAQRRPCGGQTAHRRT